VRDPVFFAGKIYIIRRSVSWQDEWYREAAMNEVLGRLAAKPRFK